MAAFEYVALNTRGKQTKGILEADTARQVRQMLRDQGLSPMQVDVVAQQQTETSKRKQWFAPRIKAADLALVTRQLATLVKAGLPVEEALKAVAEQCDKAKLKSLFLGVRARVMEGHTLADGLGDYPAAFDNLYRSMVAAGEKSGHLDSVLERLADYTESSQQTRQQVVAALVYPALLVVVALGIVTLLMVYAVPQVVEQFTYLDAQLPLLTRILIAVSDFIQGYGLWVLVLLVLLVIGTSYLLKNPDIRLWWHKLQLKLPLIGKLVNRLNTARFASTLSILHSSGVPLLDSLSIAGDVMSNEALKQAVLEARTKVREGGSLRAALQQTGQFPPMMLHMIASGEKSGELEDMLERAATNQQNMFENTINMLLSVLGPFIILLMGGLVLTIVLAMMLPIIQLNSLIGQ